MSENDVRLAVRPSADLNKLPKVSRAGLSQVAERHLRHQQDVLSHEHDDEAPSLDRLLFYTANLGRSGFRIQRQQQRTE